MERAPQDSSLFLFNMGDELDGTVSSGERLEYVEIGELQHRFPDFVRVFFRFVDELDSQVLSPSRL